jgi:hypothetical protein
MNKAIKFIETVSIADEEFGETLETVSVSEAIIACKIHELEVLTEMVNVFFDVKPFPASVQTRITHLEKELRNIKIK